MMECALAEKLSLEDTCLGEIQLCSGTDKRQQLLLLRHSASVVTISPDGSGHALKVFRKL